MTSSIILYGITLPMRDWDTFFPSIIHCFIVGLHYLWGIETTHTGSYPWDHWHVDYITYEGLRRSAVVIMIVSIFDRITLPMRDWDNGFSPLLNLLSRWITLPMRDWDTCFNPQPVSLRRLGLHYLWGIETNLVFFFWFHFLFRITLPMRDWDVIPPCFLIAWFIVDLVDYITYEGLRLSVTLLVSKLLKSDYITYEGLRLNFRYVKKVLYYRITLPMRDWDMYKSSLIYH